MENATLGTGADWSCAPDVNGVGKRGKGPLKAAHVGRPLVVETGPLPFRTCGFVTQMLTPSFERLALLFGSRWAMISFQDLAKALQSLEKELKGALKAESRLVRC